MSRHLRNKQPGSGTVAIAGRGPRFASDKQPGSGSGAGASTGSGTSAMTGSGSETGAGSDLMFDHEKLDVYRVAREFYRLVQPMLKKTLPRDTRDQLDRAALS